MRIAVVTGNPKPASRTHGVALAWLAGHSLAVEVHLRPVLVELGSSVPARGLYVTEPELAEPDAAVARWAATAIPLIRGALAAHEASDAEQVVAERVDGQHAGPGGPVTGVPVTGVPVTGGRRAARRNGAAGSPR